MGTSGKEVGGVRAVAGAEVGHCDSNVGVHSGVSVFLLFLLFLFLLTIFLGKEGGSAGPAPLPNGGV